jgi:glyoxylase-like metal-dependent hydrolase (beta-lactamase superfamily II)/rhodanese-related sulfurtransferase
MDSELETSQELSLQETPDVPEISVSELYRRISQPNEIFLLDVRNQEDFDAWRVEGRYTPETMHLFYGDFMEDEQAAAAKIPNRDEVVVVCAKGGASAYVAEILRGSGIQAVNMAGGMEDWGRFYDIQTVRESEAYSIYQVSRPARGCLSYILVSQGQAALLDPLRHTGAYLEKLEQAGASLAFILDTHAHADHISGGPALAEMSGAPYYLHPYDGIHPFDMLPAVIPYRPLQHAQELRLGELTLEILHVPGHTLGQVNVLVRAGSGETYLFTGDNLFIQSFGRPDLGGQGASWAPLVYQSIFETIRGQVPPSALVLPGHFARHEEAGPEGLFAAELESLWTSNRDLQVESREEFIQHVLGHLPAMPQQYIEIKRVNGGLSHPDEEAASELELGKNVCALSTAYPE